MTALSIVVWFNRAYQYLGLDGCSSHSGRRTFITQRPGSSTKPAGHCATCSYWLVTARSKLLSDTSTAIPTPNASSSR